MINQQIPIHIMAGVQSVSAGDSHTMILKNDNTLWAVGWNNHGQLGDGSETNRTVPVSVME